MPMISFEEARKIRRVNRKSDAQLSGEDYQIAHVKMLQEIRNRASSGRMQDLNGAARSQERERKRLITQRQESSLETVDKFSIEPTTVGPLTAVSRRKKPGQGESK